MVTTSAKGQTRKIRRCPLHVCFTPKPGRSRAQVEMSEKGHKRTRGTSTESSAGGLMSASLPWRATLATCFLRPLKKLSLAVPSARR